MTKERRKLTTPRKKSKPRIPTSPRPPVSPSHRPPVITLLTDFGTSDYFVGAMKGVILGTNPDVRIVDITHDIPAGDIESGAFTILAVYRSFSSGSIHVAVVDPGVGSDRRPLLVQAGGHSFVGPDNGIFSYVCRQEPKAKVFELTNANYFRREVSATFHGRDIFAPAAAALSTAIKPSTLGREVETMVHLEPLRPERFKNGDLKARIIHIDRFGNCITNLSQTDLTATMIERGAALKVNGTTVKSFRKFFSERTGDKKELFGIWGSAGFLELAAMNESAAEILDAKRGDPVRVTCH